MGDKFYKCSICGATYKGFGNNPWPVTTGEDDKCCDGCNSIFVIPARIGQIKVEDIKVVNK